MRIAKKIVSFLQHKTAVPLAECSLLQLAQALRGALACGTGLSTLKSNCVAHKTAGRASTPLLTFSWSRLSEYRFLKGKL